VLEQLTLVVAQVVVEEQVPHLLHQVLLVVLE
jgi:hypothetical protein